MGEIAPSGTQCHVGDCRRSVAANALAPQTFEADGDLLGASGPRKPPPMPAPVAVLL